MLTGEIRRQINRARHDDAGLLYESPLTDKSPLGVEGVFGRDRAAKVVSIIHDINRRTAA